MYFFDLHHPENDSFFIIFVMADFGPNFFIESHFTGIPNEVSMRESSGRPNNGLWAYSDVLLKLGDKALATLLSLPAKLPKVTIVAIKGHTGETCVSPCVCVIVDPG